MELRGQKMNGSLKHFLIVCINLEEVNKEYYILILDLILYFLGVCGCLSSGKKTM
jgi:hypothetical protein